MSDTSKPFEDDGAQDPSRRRFTAAVAGGIAATVLSSPAIEARAATPTPTPPAADPPAPAAGLERGKTRVAGFADAEMDFQLIRQMGAARYGGASVGECLALARQIESGVPASWVAAFAAAGARQEADAGRRAARGHARSARDQCLVACNHYRAAEYYTDVTDPKHREYGLKSRECFLAAMRLQGEPCEVLWLPFGPTPLPAYFLRSKNPAGAAGKTLMIQSGYDGTLEETYIAYGLPALERGYHLMLFAGPGQMDTVRFHPRLPFIHDTERVAAAALDELLKRPEVDPLRVALMGISFGGYFAIRSAAYEPRIRALIANSPITDLHAYMVSFAGFDPAELADGDDIRLADIDRLPDATMPPQTKKMTRNLIRRFGRDSFKQTYLRLREFRVEEKELAGIRCPALGLIGAGEGAQPMAQYRQFLRQVGGAAGHVFSAEEGADGHCQSGNLAYSAAVALDWLDEAFD